MIGRWIALVIFVGLGNGGLQARIDEPPAGLSVVDWAAIRALYEQHRHTATLGDDGSYVARNPRQGWRIRFDGRGFLVKPDEGDWTWGLELVGFGVSGAPQAIEGGARAVTADGGRVSYVWRPNLEEWFVNDQRGLEHGWTISERPVGVGARLDIELAVRGGLMPRADNADGAAVCFVDDSGAAVVTYAGLKAWDADGRRLPSRMVIHGDRGLSISVDDSGARYPVTIDPVAVQTAYIKASNAKHEDFFGYAMALSGDTLAVGALAEDSGATGINGDQTSNAAPSSGAVYIFQRTGGIWTQQAYVKASNTDDGDNFGFAVALSGDTLAVGAYAESSDGVGVNPDTQADNSKLFSGAVYVFERMDGVWAQQAYIKSSNTDTDDQFGVTLALSGDTLAVGARNEDSNGIGVNPDSQADNSTESSGAVYVFRRTGGVWTQQAFIKASNTELNDSFGHSLALSGDTLAVGVSREDSNGTGVDSDAQANNSAINSGAVYVFQRTDGVWDQHAYIKASNTDTSDEFGSTVALSGDTLAVGATGEGSNGVGVNPDTQADNSGDHAGAVYIFERLGGAWVQQAYIKASNTDTADKFGFAMALSGGALAVGATGERSNGVGVNSNAQADNSTPNSGAVYVFRRIGDLWNQRAYVKASNTDPNDLFGFALTLSGDTLAVGAYEEAGSGQGVNPNAQGDNSAVLSGAAYAFGLCELATTEIDQVSPSPANAGETYQVSFMVSNQCGDTILGTVAISDGEGGECTGSAPVGSCLLTSTTAGVKTVTATYLGDGTFAPSSASVEHEVRATTTTAIGAISPSPSMVGQSYAVSYIVSSTGGTPTGSVTVSDGSASNTCDVASGSCSLTSVTASAKSITLSYLGEGSFDPSSNAGAHTVNPATTTTTVGTPSPAFPFLQVSSSGLGSFPFLHTHRILLGEPYSLPYTVSSAGGTPTGSVTVSDGTASNTCNVADGSCSLTSATLGVKTLSASYLGDGNFAPSSGAVSVQVCSYALSPASNALTAVGGSGAILVTAPDGCPWTAYESLPWLSIVSGASGVGSGTIGYQVAPNSDVLARSGNIVVADQTHAVTQSGVPCTYSITPETNSLGAVGGSGAIFVTTPPSCAWTVSESLSWVTVVSGASGSGDGTVAYQVSPFAQAGVRQGEIVVSGKTHAITQAGGPTLASELGAFTNGAWFLDRNGDFAFDGASEISGWGSPGDTPVNGDWNGDGFRDLGVFSNGTWFLDRNGDAAFDPATEIQGWGAPGWIPVTGDWNGDGVTDIGAIDPATMAWFVDLNGDFAFDPATEIRGWGSPGDTPVVGDWDGDGDDDIGVFSGGTWFIDFNGDGGFQLATDQRGWGVAGWIPVVGDWDGDGADELGAIEPTSMAWFRDVNGDFLFDQATELVGWGSPGDQPVVADWNGDGADDVGVFSGGTWFIDAAGDGAFDPATDIRGWGVAGWTPVQGAWQ